MMSALVVDTSVALKWYVLEPESDLAERLLHQPVSLHAPTLLKVELANALATHVRRRLIDASQASIALGGTEQTIETWHETGDMLPQALAWSIAYRHPIYDFCYLALARSLGAQVVTADDAFLRKIEGGPEAGLAISLTDIR